MATLTISPEEEKRVKALGFLSNKGTDNFSARIITVNGKITAAKLKCISEAAEQFGNGSVVFTTRLTVEVQGVPFDKIEAFRAYIAREGMVTGGTGRKVRPVVSCKGTTCQYGLIDTFMLSEEIHRRFFEGYNNVMLPHKFKIAVGGCPNNCVKPDLNDIGIIGQMKPQFDAQKCRGCKKCGVENACPVNAAQIQNGRLSIDSQVCISCGRCQGRCYFNALSGGQHGYKIYIGGRWGKQISQGRALQKLFADKEDALSVIEKALLLFREQGRPGERFAQTIERLGFENVEQQLLTDDLLTERRKF